MKNILPIGWSLYSIAILSIFVLGLIPVIRLLVNEHSLQLPPSTIFIGIVGVAFVLVTFGNLIQFVLYAFKKRLQLRKGLFVLSFIVMTIYLLYYLIMMIIDKQLHIQFPMMAVLFFLQYRMTKASLRQMK
jgi:hypothetical protein